MWVNALVSVGFLLALVLPKTASCSCLPQGIKCDSVVSATLAKPGGKVRRVTVEQKLRELRARCRRGKPVDTTGKDIYFYQLKGCWGNPPEDYQEILKRQNEELKNLRKRYRVIEMTCNPSGQLISRMSAQDI